MTSMSSRPRETSPRPAGGLDRERLEEALGLLAEGQEQLAEAFYERFFARHPEVVPLFGEHAESEREEMMNETLNSLLGWCEAESWLDDNLEAMGASHWEYGVQGEMYDAFAAVFLECVGEQLGAAWSEPLAAAFAGALGEVTDTMRRAGDGAAERDRERRRRAERRSSS